jgi:two-component system probable response regulator PhcQ
MGNRTLLIVDDEALVRSALRRSLRLEGYSIFTAAGAEEGLALLKEHPIDLVMSDHLMAGMNGTEFLGRVRDLHPSVGRILLTGHADMDSAIKAINQGEIYRFLLKPWDETELKITLHLAFERVDLERENRRLLATVRRQQARIEDLEGSFPGISKVDRDSDGAILLSRDEEQFMDCR